MRVLLAVAVLLTTPAVAEADAQSDLDAAKAKWAQEGFEHYRMTVQVSCFCPSEYTRAYVVHVRNGEPYQPPKYVKAYASVPRLFATVQRAIDGDGEASVTYGARGVPVRLGLDPIPQAVDDESTITVSKLVEENDQPPKVPDRSITDGSALNALEDAERRWREGGLTDYRFRLQRSCFCTTDSLKPRTVVVRGGKAVKNGPRVEGLFKVIRGAIRDEVALLRVRYAKSGLPKFIGVDRDFMIADEEFSLSASRLRSP